MLVVTGFLSTLNLFEHQKFTAFAIAKQRLMHANTLTANINAKIIPACTHNKFKCVRVFLKKAENAAEGCNLFHDMIVTLNKMLTTRAHSLDLESLFTEF